MSGDKERESDNKWQKGSEYSMMGKAMEEAGEQGKET